MLSRERVLAALSFRPVDAAPLRISAAAGGLFEHGAKLVDLIRRTGHDFGDFDALTLPPPPRPQDYDEQGRYHAYRTDAWGTRWQYLIYGVWGRVVEYPLADLARLNDYRMPALPPAEGPEFEAAKQDAARCRQRFFHLESCGSIFEQMHCLRPFEAVLMDIMEDNPAIGRLADRLTDRCVAMVQRAAALGADGVRFGDDFGTQQALIFPPAVWRRFFKPRYQRMFAPARQAGMKVFFHCCGQISAILEDFAELGVNAIWPQLPLWNARDLADRCRRLGLAVEMHPDRGELMQRGSPGQVRDYLHKLIDDFDTLNGGSILYIEVDPNFPWPNVQALFQTAQEFRHANREDTA